MTKARLILFVSIVATAMLVAPLQAVVIVDDSWADGGRDNGADPLDTNWWTSSSSSGIEVSVGSLGMVTGTSGRGIHGIFPSQTLNVGDTLKATYTFTTPATIGTGSSAFRVGLFDTLGRTGLDADISASSSSPNPLYNDLPGYMLDMDVNTGGTENLNFRRHIVTSPSVSSGRLLATTTGFFSLGGGGDPYTFAPNATYSGMFSVTSTGSGLELTAMLSDATGLLSTHTFTDVAPDSNTFGMLGFHANSNIFGSSNTPGDPDNGIDFSNIKIELNMVPEPSILVLLFGALLSVGRMVRKR